mgnify:CR=1 FL=1
MTFDSVYLGVNIMSEKLLQTATKLQFFRCDPRNRILLQRAFTLQSLLLFSEGRWLKPTRNTDTRSLISSHQLSDQALLTHSSD